jgi:hypothetical protein
MCGSADSRRTKAAPRQQQTSEASGDETTATAREAPLEE